MGAIGDAPGIENDVREMSYTTGQFTYRRLKAPYVTTIRRSGGFRGEL
jgi:hypothetical protein